VNLWVPAGLMYWLQSPTNLVDRADQTNIVADPGALTECVEEMETGVPACFYRLRRP
jgi:hypothetical protein